jgi:hypothetical protein
VRGMYLHSERLLSKAGVSLCFVHRGVARKESAR